MFGILNNLKKADFTPFVHLWGIINSKKITPNSTVNSTHTKCEFCVNMTINTNAKKGKEKNVNTKEQLIKKK